MPEPRNILIDTDPGQDIDDLLAIHFALLRPELAVRAITTVTWPADQRARLVRCLLHHMGKGEIPVGVGMAFPLRPLDDGERERQFDLNRVMNHACFADEWDDAANPAPRDAVDVILETVNRYAGNIMFACIGPLTNVAVALQKQPDIAGKISAIALMGGEVNLMRAEHNIAFDPVAADLVLRAGIPIQMGTWDVTRQFQFEVEACDRIAAGTPLGIALARAVRAWHPAQNWKAGPVMYDLFPMIAAFRPDLYPCEPMTVTVELTGGATRGLTIRHPGGSRIAVTTGINTDAVATIYWDTVSTRPEARSLP